MCWLQVPCRPFPQKILESWSPGECGETGAPLKCQAANTPVSEGHRSFTGQVFFPLKILMGFFHETEPYLDHPPHLFQNLSGLTSRRFCVAAKGSMCVTPCPQDSISQRSFPASGSYTLSALLLQCSLSAVVGWINREAQWMGRALRSSLDKLASLQYPLS